MFWRKVFVLLLSWSTLMGCFWSTMIAQGTGEASAPSEVSPFIRGTVWNDLDADGVYGDELGLGNIRVALLDHERYEITSTTTTLSGTYLFDSLGQERYYLQFGTPADMQFTSSHRDPDMPLGIILGVEGLIMGPIDITSTAEITIDMGYYLPPLLQVGISTGGVSVWNGSDPITYTLSVTNVGTGTASESYLNVSWSFNATLDREQSSPRWDCDDSSRGLCTIRIDGLDANVVYHEEVVLIPERPLLPDVTRFQLLANAYSVSPPQAPCGCDPLVHTILVNPTGPEVSRDPFASYLPIWY